MQKRLIRRDMPKWSKTTVGKTPVQRIKIGDPIITALIRA